MYHIQLPGFCSKVSPLAQLHQIQNGFQTAGDMHEDGGFYQN